MNMEVFTLTTCAVAVCSWVRYWTWPRYRYHVLMYLLFLTRVKYMIFMTAYHCQKKEKPMTFKEMWSLVKKLHIPNSLNSLKSEKKESTSLSSTPSFWKSIVFFLRFPGFTCWSFWQEWMSIEHWWNDAGRRTKVVGEGPVPFCPQIIQWLVQGQTWIFMKRCRQLTAWTMAQLFWSLKFVYIICKHSIPASQKTLPIRGSAQKNNMGCVNTLWIKCRVSYCGNRW